VVTEKKKRVLPHNLDAEASILGGIILHNEAIKRVADLEADHFYDPRHRFVFGAMRQLEGKARPLDIVTIEVELQLMGKLEALGGVAFLGELALRVPTPDNVAHYAADVIRFYRWRRLMEHCSETIERGYDGFLDEDPMMEAAEIAADAARGIPTGYITLGKAIGDERDRVIDLVTRRNAGEDIYACCPSGFRDIDYNLGGAPYGQVTLIEGLRSGAKTTFMQEWSENTARILTLMKPSQMAPKKIPRQVAYVYYEDSAAFFAQRAIAGDTAREQSAVIHTENIGRLQLDPARLELFNAHAERLIKAEQTRVLLIPGAGMDGEKLGRVLMRLHSEGDGLAAFFVDYLQRMRPPRGYSSVADMISANSSIISDIAQQTGAAAIVAAQLNPDIESRDWKKEGGPVPRLGDCRGSRGPENDARQVLAIFDRWKYGVRTGNEHVRYDPQPGRDKEQLRRNMVEIHVLKRNQGDSELVLALEWIREAHALRDLPRTDVGRQQLDLTRAADDEEAWRLRMSQGDGRETMHR
jgi:replicative DNA helicase